jgi:hypothetical protein
MSQEIACILQPWDSCMFGQSLCDDYGYCVLHNYCGAGDGARQRKGKVSERQEQGSLRRKNNQRNRC